MEVKTIFIKDLLLQELTNDIQEVANVVTEIGEVVKKRFPELKWNTALLWVLVQNYEVRNYFMHEIARRNANANGFDCAYKPFGEIDAIDKMSDTVREQRRFNEMLISRDTRVIKSLDLISKNLGNLKNLSTYLRTGALYIDEDGYVIIADNAKQLLQAYCSVTAENKNELAFVAKIEAMKEAAIKIKQLQVELSALAAKSKGKKSIADSCYAVERLLVAENMRLTSDSVTWRALVTFLATYRSKDTPRFFNTVGIPAFDAENIYNVSGYLWPATPGLRMRYPQLYKNVDYRGRYGSGIYDNDTLEDYKELEVEIKRCKANEKYREVYIDEHGYLLCKSKYIAG